MRPIHFTLAGEEFELSRADVEDGLKHIAPDDVRKYYISVHGRRYPVKQALATTIKRPTERFISTDATRVLANLGFEIERLDSGRTTDANVRTESELLFEEYLNSQGLGYFEFEPHIEGSTRRPDYRLIVSGTPILFEVKEFRPDPALFQNLSGSAYDPYRLIREKIQAGRKKFKDIEEFPCCLVLYNCGHPLVNLGWQFVYGSMLGNLGYQMPVNMETDRGDAENLTPVLRGDGEMLRLRGGQIIAPQNTTISAIIVIEHFGLGVKRLSTYIDRIKAASGGGIGAERVWRISEESRGTERDASLRQLRVVVYENPFSRLSLPRALFVGSFDERYGELLGKITRVYAGQQILDIEQEEEATRRFCAELRQEGGDSNGKEAEAG